MTEWVNLHDLLIFVLLAEQWLFSPVAISCLKMKTFYELLNMTVSIDFIPFKKYGNPVREKFIKIIWTR